MTKQEIQEFIERMQEAGDDWTKRTSNERIWRYFS